MQAVRSRSLREVASTAIAPVGAAGAVSGPHGETANAAEASARSGSSPSSGIALALPEGGGRTLPGSDSSARRRVRERPRMAKIPNVALTLHESTLRDNGQVP